MCKSVGLCVCLCVYMCKHVSLRVSVFESLSAYLYVCIFYIFNNLLYSIPCLSLATKTLTSSHLLILTSTHNEHIHMISSNILMNIFMQVFGVCKSYNYITHLSTYTPTRSRANRHLVWDHGPVTFWHSKSGSLEILWILVCCGGCPSAVGFGPLWPIGAFPTAEPRPAQCAHVSRGIRCAQHSQCGSVAAAPW